MFIIARSPTRPCCLSVLWIHPLIHLSIPSTSSSNTYISSLLSLKLSAHSYFRSSSSVIWIKALTLPNPLNASLHTLPPMAVSLPLCSLGTMYIPLPHWVLIPCFYDFLLVDQEVLGCAGLGFNFRGEGYTQCLTHYHNKISISLADRAMNG